MLKRLLFDSQKYFLLILFLSAYSCKTYIPFDANLNKQCKENGIDVLKVQFYNSDKLVIEREVTSGSALVNGGVIKFKNGKKIEQVLIKRHTPGVALTQSTDVEKSNHCLSVAFQVENNETFAFQDWKKNNPAHFYTIGGELINGVFQILYAGNYYVTVEGAPFLVVDARIKNKLKKTAKILKGRTVE